MHVGLGMSSVYTRLLIHVGNLTLYAFPPGDQGMIAFGSRSQVFAVVISLEGGLTFAHFAVMPAVRHSN